MEFDMHVDSLGKVDDIFAFYKFLCEEKGVSNAILLESVQEESHVSLYSFICANPDFLLQINGKRATIRNITSERGELLKQQIETREEQPFPAVQQAFKDEVQYHMPAFDLIKRYFPYSKTQFPEIFPRHLFYGGLVGYIGYDVVAPWVKYTPKREFPDAILAMATKVLVYSHESRALFQIDNALNDYQPPVEMRELVQDFKVKTADKPITGFKIPDQIDTSKFQSNMDEEKFEDIVGQAKENILRGDVTQVVLSRKLRLESSVSPMNVYQTLRRLNPSPYMYFLNLNGCKIIGSSPEALVTVDRGVCETVPIAGTRRRGKTEKEDLKFEKELMDDPKEAAEHIMLVDLARNDLAKISVPGSVDTYEKMRLRRYKDVMHIISKVRSRTNFHGVDVLKSMFPAGTVSGAPKLRAMEIIRDLEREPRGPYAGVVGYFALNGDCDWAIAIRSLFVKNQTFTGQAGAGIVADSDPRLEWIETRNKLASVLKSVMIAEANEK
ncbi:MAG: anthranilate synthase component I [Promethearchaeota archaeon CR_4]|nr:MAG: anthranilate synthase component I [Candidatus Lokiarchaeota archaeon CR_4]